MNDGLGFCAKASSVVQIIGYVLLIVKIVVPLIIIIFGSIEFGKAVTSGDQKDINETLMRLLKRIIIGIVIFILPSIVRIIYFGIFNGNQSQEMLNDASVCIDCLTGPKGCHVTTEMSVLK